MDVRTCVGGGRFGISVLRHMARDRETQAEIVGHNGLNVVVVAMRAHRGNGDVLEEACGCLFNLTCSRENQQLLLRNDGAALVAQTAFEFSGQAGVVAEAVGTLANLAWVDAHRSDAHDHALRVLPLVGRCVLLPLLAV